MAKIKIHCNGCGSDFETNRTEEIPEDATSLVCNWCPDCEDKATDYYKEEYIYLEIDEIKDPNQQSLF